MNPLVALTTTIDPKGGDYLQPRIAVYAVYLEALQRAGLTPVLVTPAHEARAIDELVQRCSGLVLSGGEDIDPSRYGEKPIPQLGPVNPPRDAAEFRALEAAIGRDIPILGICRGHQLLNVFLGGTLHQDIGTELGVEFSHQQSTEWGFHHHEATVQPESRVGRAIRTEHLEINSYHHQAIRELAPSLEATARAGDGLIEAVESRDHRWVVGVQWHPERKEAEENGDCDPNTLLFEAFANAVRQGSMGAVREAGAGATSEKSPDPIAGAPT